MYWMLKKLTCFKGSNMKDGLYATICHFLFEHFIQKIMKPHIWFMKCAKHSNSKIWCMTLILNYRHVLLRNLLLALDKTISGQNFVLGTCSEDTKFWYQKTASAVRCIWTTGGKQTSSKLEERRATWRYQTNFQFCRLKFHNKVMQVRRQGQYSSCMYVRSYGAKTIGQLTGINH